MMAKGEIAGPGVFVPEQIVPCDRFFREFACWGVTVDAQMREILAAPGGLNLARAGASSPAGAAPQRSSAACAAPVSTSSNCAMRRALRMPQSS